LKLEGLTMMKQAIVAAAVVLMATAGTAAARSKARAAASCPSINVLTDATRITQFDKGHIDLKAEIRDPEIACSLSGGKAKSNLSFWVKSAISPDSKVGERRVPYFIAIILEGQVVGKEIFDLDLAFDDERKLFVKEKVARVDIPVAPDKTAEDYSVTIGFQLTPEQATYNRTAQR
jgi:hypothetical protein